MKTENDQAGTQEEVVVVSMEEALNMIEAGSFDADDNAVSEFNDTPA